MHTSQTIKRPLNIVSLGFLGVENSWIKENYGLPGMLFPIYILCTNLLLCGENQ